MCYESEYLQVKAFYIEENTKHISAAQDLLIIITIILPPRLSKLYIYLSFS